MSPAGWKLFGHAMFELSQLNVTEVAKFVQRNFQNLFTKAAPPGKQIQPNQEIDRLADDWSPVGAFSEVGHYVPDSYSPSKTPFGRADSESRSQIRPELFLSTPFGVGGVERVGDVGGDG